MPMNQQGQASSVFQLLIAAVVALAILAVLMSVLGVLDNFFAIGQDPTQAASDVLKNAVISPSALKTSGKVSFSDGVQLYVGGIANKASAGIQAEDLCLSLGDFEDNSRGFSYVVEGKTIKYTGSSSQTARIEVLCDFGEEKLAQTMDNYALESSLLGSCPFESVSSQSDPLICVIALRIQR